MITQLGFRQPPKRIQRDDLNLGILREGFHGGSKSIGGRMRIEKHSHALHAAPTAGFHFDRNNEVFALYDIIRLRSASTLLTVPISSLELYCEITRQKLFGFVSGIISQLIKWTCQISNEP